MTTLQSICTDVLRELRIVGLGEDAGSEDAAQVLNAYNRMVASWAQMGITVFYPTITGTWRRAWTSLSTYTAGDGVTDGGEPYTCILSHTSSVDDEPGRSINGATYWTPLAYTALTLTSTFPLSPAFEEAVIAQLAVRVCGTFGKQPDALLMKRARDGWATIASEYMRTPDATFDSALVRLPSRRWPYSVPVTEIQ